MNAFTCTSEIIFNNTALTLVETTVISPNLNYTSDYTVHSLKRVSRCTPCSSRLMWWTRVTKRFQIYRLETKASSHEGQCIPAGSSVSPPRKLLITLSIITMRSRIFTANAASDCLHFAKFRPQFCESCGAIYRRICEMLVLCKVHSGPVTDVENSVYRKGPALHCMCNKTNPVADVLSTA